MEQATATSFPRAPRGRLGYQPEAVDALLRRAKVQYENPSASEIFASELRGQELPLVKNGYSISAVDTALDRIEDALADRELKHDREFRGEYTFIDRIDRMRSTIQGRLNLPAGRKFRRTGLLTRGYHRKQVDAMCERISRQLQYGGTLTAQEVRSALFAPRRGGYHEAQVDAYLNRVVEVLQLERNRP